jgi:hypothetical protein
MSVSPQSLYEQVLELTILYNLSATEIYGRLLRSGDASTPHLRTIQRWAREMVRRKDSQTWSLSESDILEAREVIPVLEVVIVRSAGGIRTVSQSEARWIGLVAACAPSLHKWHVWVLARLYEITANQDGSFQELDAFLAFTPWIDRQAFENYLKAIDLGLVSMVPLGDYLLRRP